MSSTQTFNRSWPWEASWNKIILLALVGLPKWLKGGEVVEIPKEVENKEPEATEARHGCNSMLASGFLTSHGIAVKASKMDCIYVVIFLLKAHRKTCITI